MSIAATRASIIQGLQVMTVNPLRTALSTLGVVIGVSSVIATLALTDGLDLYFRDRLATQTDVQSITISSKTVEMRDGFAIATHGFPIFGLADAAELREGLPAGSEVTMVVGGQTVVASAWASPHVASVTATMANYVIFNRKDVVAGRYFTETEAARNAPVVVLSYKLAAELSPNGEPANMVGRVVRVHGRPLTAVGVMPAYTDERTFQVFIPVRAAAAAFGARDPVTPQLIVRAATIELIDATKEDIIEWAATRYRDWERRVTVTTSMARLEQVRSGMLLMKLVLGALAGISLIVGGVGIMNVLLASVAERTREIGVRKAMGARQRDILYQFLAESVAIAGVGSGVGTTMGLLLAFGVAAVVRWQVPGAPMYAAITSGTLITSVLSAAIVGLTFGTFPALRASRLSPIDAIRHD